MPSERASDDEHVIDMIIGLASRLDYHDHEDEDDDDDDLNSN